MCRHDDRQVLSSNQTHSLLFFVQYNVHRYEPYVAPTLAKVAGPAVANTWFGSALLPATLAYSTVKGVGWNDWGNAGLSEHELRLNGLAK